VSPVKYEMGFYISEDDILHSHCRENLKSYKRTSSKVALLLSVGMPCCAALFHKVCPVETECFAKYSRRVRQKILHCEVNYSTMFSRRCSSNHTVLHQCTLCHTISTEHDKITSLRLHLCPPLWSGGQSSWPITQSSWVRFPALPNDLHSSGSVTGSTQPREDK
jgi:hypothetical protein